MLEDHTKQLKTKISQKHNSLSLSSTFGQKLASSASLCIREKSPSSRSTTSPKLTGKRRVAARETQQEILLIAINKKKRLTKRCKRYSFFTY